ncbi:MAG: hypothetical protein Ta2E_04790 [Mycoplasmoidaceae bacterium]|nr:MAG: hypothetical protein Ta2E_04790 [Mycoplasmoidaceae bacterium]
MVTNKKIFIGLGFSSIIGFAVIPSIITSCASGSIKEYGIKQNNILVPSGEYSTIGLELDTKFSSSYVTKWSVNIPTWISKYLSFDGKSTLIWKGNEWSQNENIPTRFTINCSVAKGSAERKISKDVYIVSYDNDEITDYDGHWVPDNWIGYKNGNIELSDDSITEYRIVSSTNFVANNLVIPEHVFNSGNRLNLHSIGEEAFSKFASNSASLTGTLSLPGSLTVIGDRAFSNNGELEGSLDLSKGNQVKQIGQSAFENCTKFTELVLPKFSSLDYVAANAFKNCGLINKIDISSWGEEILTGDFGTNAFSGFKASGTFVVQNKTNTTVWGANGSALKAKFSGNFTGWSLTNA